MRQKDLENQAAPGNTGTEVSDEARDSNPEAIARTSEPVVNLDPNGGASALARGVTTGATSLSSCMFSTIIRPLVPACHQEQGKAHLLQQLPTLELLHLQGEDVISLLSKA